jgi:hypothetical protein
MHIAAAQKIGEVGMKVRLVGLGLALLASSAPVFAASIVNATRIRITNTNNTWLQVAELQAFNFSSVNVALGGTAVGTGGTWDATSTPGKAIDGNTGGGFYTDTIFHPAVEPNTFLDVTFGPSNLASLKIFGRTDCCSSRDIYTYSIFDTDNVLLGTGTLDATGATHSASVTFDAVPEPATWGMMILGFGLAGGALRASRRRTRVTYATA